MKINGTSVKKASFGKDKELIHSLYINDELKWSLFSGTENTTTCSIVAATGVTLPSNLQIPKSFSLSNINNKKPVTNIQTNGFKNRTEVTSISIPDSVTSIGGGAFAGCNKLDSITIPFIGANSSQTAGASGQYPFGYIFGGSSFSGGEATQQYAYITNPGGTTSVTYHIPKTLKKVIVTGGTEILYGAFYNCKNLTRVTLPTKLTAIRSHAFANCTGLDYIVIPKSVTTIENFAFGGCKNGFIIYCEVEEENKPNGWANSWDNSGDRDINYTVVWGACTTGEHAWNTGTITKKATCTSTGTKTYTCATCGRTKTESISMLAHNWNNGDITEEATCTGEGTKTYTCTVCDTTKTENIPATGHSYGGGSYCAPTATEGGKYIYTCNECGESYPEYTGEPALGYKVSIINNSYNPRFIINGSTEKIFVGEERSFVISRSPTGGGPNAFVSPTIEVTGASYSTDKIEGLETYTNWADDKTYITVDKPTGTGISDTVTITIY